MRLAVTRLIQGCGVAAIACAALSADAHTIIKDPAPIGDMTQIKTGPCGCVFTAGDPDECPATYPVRQLTTGQQLDVVWTEFIDHPGKFRVALSTVAPEDVTMDDLDNGVLWEGPDMNTAVPTDIMQTILVPATPCTKCTLQVRQYMSDSQDYYFSCAAVQILDSGEGGAGPSTTATTGTGGAEPATTATSGVTTTGGSSDGPHYVPEPGDPSKCSIGSPADPSSGGAGSLVGAGLAVALGIGRRRRA